MKCSVSGCDRTNRIVKGMCIVHYNRARKYGTPGGPIPDRTPRGERHPNWSAKPTYEGAHQRVRRELGSATLHECVSCGGTANQWAYQHNDPAAIYDEARACYYSADPKFYRPMCYSCHLRFDGRPPRPACSVDDCEAPNKAHGMCAKHYSRARRRGLVR